jgi:hypothetical protein
MKNQNPPNDWIYIDNTKCPVRADRYVLIEDESGTQDTGMAYEFDWLIQEPSCRIVKYATF